MDGWLFIDKPKNVSSFQVIRRLRKSLNLKKIGHAGTLDPFATGILAIALGEATKSIQFFKKNRFYIFKVIFGEEKDTDDITGKTTSYSNLIPSKKEIDNMLSKFIGSQIQVPPKYSAVKIKGKRAYQLARDNKKFQIRPKNIFINKLKCLKAMSRKEYLFELECSSGTYVRSIARDLAKMLGTYAYVSELRRTKIGKIDQKDIILLDNFEELVHIGDHFKTMHSIRDVLDDIPAVLINNELGQRFINGLSFDFFNSKSNLDCLLIENENRFLGVGKAVEGKIKPIRVFNL